MGEDTDAKLGAIQADLLSLTKSISSVNVKLEKIRSDVESNSGRLAIQEAMLETMQLKLADMEDRGNRVEFFLLYPAILKVKAAGKTEAFQSTEGGTLWKEGSCYLCLCSKQIW